MSGQSDAAEVEALARAFARHLEHLREFRGVHYVGAADTPVAEAAVAAGLDAAAAVGQAPEPEPEPEPEPASPPLAAAPAPARGGGVESPPAQSLSPGPNHPQSPTRANQHVLAPVPNAEPPRAAARARGQQWPAAKKLAYLRERNVGDCHRCPLSETRRNIVFGVGDPEADLMFVGEAPGADEDRLGEPFVGAAGQRLNRWLEQLGLRREQVYIANVLKCRPPGNRDPHPLEIDRCAPFLHAQIRAIEPKVIVALGRFAGGLLLDSNQPLYKLRGQALCYREPKSGLEIPVVVTYHPSYVIRSEKKLHDARGPRARPDQAGAIKSEDQKVLDDLARAVSLTRASGRG